MYNSQPLGIIVCLYVCACVDLYDGLFGWPSVQVFLLTWSTAIMQPLVILYFLANESFVFCVWKCFSNSQLLFLCCFHNGG